MREIEHAQQLLYYYILHTTVLSKFRRFIFPGHFCVCAARRRPNPRPNNLLLLYNNNINNNNTINAIVIIILL